MYYIIINPASRSGKGLSIWQKQVKPILDEREVPYKFYYSKKSGDVLHLTEQICKNAVHRPIKLIILGGDGTVNEAIQAIPGDCPVILGYIPTGSSNDFARDLGLFTEPALALELILSEPRIHPMDLGCITFSDGERRRFAVSCGIGYDAAVCEEAMHSTMKKVFNKVGLGKLTYLGIALKHLIRKEEITGEITLDDEMIHSMNSFLFTTVMNHRFEGGGFMFCPDADDSDGVLNLCAVEKLSTAKLLMALPAAFKGKHFKYEGINPFQAKKVHITTSMPLWVHTDGEVHRKSDNFTVTCEHHAISMIVPF